MSGTGLSIVAEDYLRVIWKAYEWSDDGITTTEIAATLGVAASSVSGNLGKLSREGLLDYEPYGRIRLSERGKRLAVTMVRRHRIIETFLVERYGYGWDEVHSEAEILEHAISDRLLALWDDELGNPLNDPHGDPIPREDGTIVRPDSRRLRELAVGRSATVIRVSDHDPELLRYLDSIGITVGTTLRVDAVREYAGSLSVVGLTADGVPDRLGNRELAIVASNAIWVTR